MNRIEKKGKVSIIDNKFVIKEDKDNTELFNYLTSRGFNNYIKFHERSDNKSKYPYIEDFSLDKYQTAEDLVNVVALLHNKTSYRKEVNLNKNKEIYDKTLGYINYLNEYFYNKIKEIEYVDYPSPSQILYMSNYSKIIELLEFDKKEIESWYILVKDKTKERVCVNHGNLTTDHLLCNENKYLISWDNATIDSPILDIITFYHNEWDNLDFKNILELYFEKCKLTDEEKKLLFINLTIPKTIDTFDDEYKNTVEVRKLLDYIYKTEELIRPYYSIQQKE